MVDGTPEADPPPLGPEPDTRPPTLTAPADVTAESPDGRPVAVELGTAVAADDVDPSPAITNDAPSLFPVGNTTVTWTAVDDAGNRATAQQTVVVVDGTPEADPVQDQEPLQEDACDLPSITKRYDSDGSCAIERGEWYAAIKDYTDGELTAHELHTISKARAWL